MLPPPPPDWITHLGICHTAPVLLQQLLGVSLSEYKRPGRARPSPGRHLLPAALLLLLLPVAGGAESIQERVEYHLASALDDGLTPVDFYHLNAIISWRQTLPDFTWVHQALDRLSVASPIDPLLADELRLLRAMVAVDEGRFDTAREYFRAMGGLQQWWATAPIDLEELEDFTTLAVPPASDQEWRAVPGTDPLGWVSLAGLAWPAQRQMIYLATTVHAERQQPVAVRLGVAQVARVWLNGAEVLTTPYPLQRAEDHATGGGWLQRGNNLLAIAVAAEIDDWWLRLRLTAPDGTVLQGVREIDSRPDPSPSGSPQARGETAPSVRSFASELQTAVAQGLPDALLSLASYQVTRRPEPANSGTARSTCRQARIDSPAEARLLEWFITSEPGTARELLEEAVQADPDLLWARLPLAVWYHKRGLRQQMAQLLEPAVAEPVAQASLLDLDATLWGPVVLPQLSRLSRQVPRCIDVAQVLTQRAADLGYWKAAQEGLERLEDLAPGYGRVLQLKERMATECGDGAALLELLGMLVRNDPNRPNLRVRLARLLAAADQPERAGEILREGIRRCPNHADLLTEMARLAHAQGDDQEAVRLARRLLEGRPQDRQARLLLSRLDAESEEESWLRSPQELWQVAGGVPAEVKPAVAVLEHHEVRFLPGQLTEERVQRAILITAAEQADSYLQHTLAHVPERQTLRVLSARILRRDGTEVAARQGDTPRLSEPEFNMYYDTRLRVLRFNQLEDGDLIEISYILSETAEANETGPYKGGLIVLGRQIPVLLAEVELTGTEELPEWELANIDGRPVRSRDEDGTVHLRFEWRDLAAIPHETPPAPVLLANPYLAYSSHPTWGDLAAWYGRHMAPRVRVSRQVEEVASRLTDGVEDRQQQIRQLYRFVTGEIRYVGLELGEHRFRPFSADWVLNHKIGDCKDKAALLVTLLRAVDIPARMALLRTADLGPAVARLALLESFNHVIVYLPEDDLWLDGTATGHDMALPPAADQNAATLIIDGEASEPQTTPIAGAGSSVYRYHLQPGERGQVAIELKVTDTGNAASRRRSQLGGSADPRRFSRWLQGLFPGADLTSDPVVVMVPGEDPAVIELEAVVPRAALQAGGGISTYPGSLGLVEAFAPVAERHTPLLLPLGPDVEWSLEVDLDRPPKALPDSVDLETPFGHLLLEVTASSDGYRLTGKLQLVPRIVAADEVTVLREFLMTVERHLGRPLEVP